jgi:hypothetical protein
VLNDNGSLSRLELFYELLKLGLHGGRMVALQDLGLVIKAALRAVNLELNPRRHHLVLHLALVPVPLFLLALSRQQVALEPTLFRIVYGTAREPQGPDLHPEVQNALRGPVLGETLFELGVGRSNFRLALMF